MKESENGNLLKKISQIEDRHENEIMNIRRELDQFNKDQKSSLYAQID